MEQPGGGNWGREADRQERETGKEHQVNKGERQGARPGQGEAKAGRGKAGE
jgi:hypothetical protein